MEELEINDPKAGLSSNTLQKLRDVIKGQSRVLWTICASASLLTSRWLLVELNVHYPLHLHFIQLATAALFTIPSDLLRLSHHSESQNDSNSINERILLVTTACLAAVSMACTMQAILHFQNLPTLVILTTMSVLVESAILLVLGLIPRSTWNILRVCVLALSSGCILVGEYRLLVYGLTASIPAALLAGGSRALRSITTEYHGNSMPNTRFFNGVFCCVGLAFTGAWIMHEDAKSFEGLLYALQWRYIPVVTLNALTTAAAMLMGRSILFPIIDAGFNIRDPQNSGPLEDVVTLQALTTVTGCTSTLMLRRPFMTWLQVLAFTISLYCIGGPPIIEYIRSWWWNRGRGYMAVSDSSGPHSFDSDATAVSEAGDESDIPNKSGRYKRSFFSVRLLVIPFTVLWTVFYILNFSERLYVDVAKAEPILDLKYTPTVPTEIVISMYKAPIEEVSQLISTLRSMPNLSSAHVHIYIKDSGANVEVIKHRTAANKVTPLPNIGREGETYLNHILTHWDELARQTVFLQADVHNPREFYPRIKEYFDPARTGMLNLGWSGQVCNCEECGDRWQFWDTTHLFSEIHGRINNSTKCDKVLLSYKGQFIVSAQRIRGIDKSIYEDLRDAFVNKNSWAHQEEYLKGRPDSMSQPMFGYAMERIWNLLFQCNSMDVAWKCPTLLSGNRMGGSIEDCQCFDPAS